MPQKISLQYIVHDRVEMFYKKVGRIPSFIPVTMSEYHTIENILNYDCMCNDKQGRKDRPIIYTVEGKDVLVVINKPFARRMQDQGLIKRVN